MLLYAETGIGKDQGRLDLTGLVLPADSEFSSTRKFQFHLHVRFQEKKPVGALATGPTV